MQWEVWEREPLAVYGKFGVRLIEMADLSLKSERAAFGILSCLAISCKIGPMVMHAQNTLNGVDLYGAKFRGIEMDKGVYDFNIAVDAFKIL